MKWSQRSERPPASARIVLEVKIALISAKLLTRARSGQLLLGYEMNERGKSHADANRQREVSELNAKIKLLVAMACATKADLARKDGELAQKDAELAQKDVELGLRFRELAEANANLIRARDELKRSKALIAEIKSSIRWRMTEPLKYVAALVRKWTW